MADTTVHRRPLCNGFCCYKTLTIIYAFFFFIIGLLLLCIGSWVSSIKASFEAINDTLSLPAILCIVMGVIMLIMAVIGIIGTLREHVCTLKCFLVFVIIAFIVQVVIGILAFVYREETVQVSSNQLKVAIKAYHDDEYVQKAVDYIQTEFSCCGLDGPSDWDFNRNFSCANKDSPSNCGLPISCCMKQTEDCLGGPSVRRRITASRLDNHGINADGCSWDFLMWIEFHLDTLGACAMGFAILHILGIFFVYMYMSKVHDYKLLFKYRKRVYEE